ncbi:MAG TPA: hypothetical protein VFS20_12405 [Longimicrobium sp.]|nr:hypothetical protein [Longimicrobium sp.]
MKKLTLDLDALALETFETDEKAAESTGTVMGNFMRTFELRCPTNYTCPNTQ